MPGLSSWSDHLLLKATNVVAFFFFFGTSIYGGLSPHGTGKITYFTPANYVFGIWTITDLLLLGYVVYQFFDESHDATHGVGWRFAILSVLNAIFLHVFVTGHYIVAFVFSLFVASTVSTIYYSLKTHYPSKSVFDTAFVHLPFSLWHAWSLVTVFIAGFAAFTHGGHSGHPGVAVKTLVVIAEAFLATTAWGYAFSSAKGDIAGAAVIAYTLYGIYDFQHNGLIRYFALGSFIFSLFAVAKSAYGAFASRDGAIALGDSERAPLVG
ncbi:hypothetical protein RQP46_007791 [Phenoliferia psychrophenolica]